MLSAALDQTVVGLQRLAEALRTISAEPIHIDVTMTPTSTGTDRILADAIKRGQFPELLEALRRIQ